jgi:hypothetical protein
MKIQWKEASAHLQGCTWLFPHMCKELLCQDVRFKTLESFCAHVWCAHGQSKKDIDPLVFLNPIRAQIATRFEHMQVNQLVDKTRNNTLRRFILKQLVLESNYAAKNLSF